MVIRKMNNVLVKHNKILFGIFSVIIIISFVWFFTPGLDGSLFFGQDQSSPNAVVGTAFGRKITNKQFQQAFRDRLLLITAMTGRDSYQMQDYIGSVLFNELAKETAAEIMGITATDAELENFIRNGFALFRGPNGFDPELYRKFAKDIQEREGRSIADFENMVRRVFSASKLEAVLLDGAIVTQDEMNQMAISIKEKFQAKMIEFPYANYLNVKKLTDEDLRNYCAANQKLFMTAPQMRALLVKFPIRPSSAAPTERAILAYYKANEKEFTVNGKVKPLTEVRGKIIQTLKLNAGRQQAQNAAKKFRDELYDAVSADTADTSSKGQIELLKKLAAKHKYQLIHTDWFTAQAQALKGIGKEPGLVAELFKTNPAHAPMMRSSYAGNNGYYVGGAAGPDEVRPSVPADFKDVKDKAAAMLSMENAKAAAREAASNFMHQIIAQKDSAAASLDSLAKKAGAKVIALPDFSRESISTAKQSQQYAMQRAVRLADKTISGVEEGPDSMFLVFLNGRQQPTAAEKAEALKNMENMLLYSKQMFGQNSLQAWIQANTKENYRTGEQSR